MRIGKSLLRTIHFGAILMSAMLNAQQSPQLHFADTQAMGLTCVQFSETASPVFNKVFAASSSHKAVQQVSFVATNQTKKSIIGIALKYRILSSGDGEISYTLKTHSYLSSSVKPLMSPGEQMLVSPDSFISESLIQPAHGLAGTVPRSKTIAQFSNASDVYITIDAVIFDDGEVMGLNQLQLAQSMQHFKEAADILARQIDAARASQQDIRASIAQLQSTPRPAADPTGKHLARLSQLLLTSRDFEFVNSYVRKIQAQPALFRRDGSAL